jgi:hypothetical protein
VDDCDLYAEGFDPVLSASERRAYNTASPDLSGVAEHVARLRAAEALVLCFRAIRWLGASRCPRHRQETPGVVWPAVPSFLGSRGNDRTPYCL